MTANVLPFVPTSNLRRLEGLMAKLPQTEMPLVHTFTPGLYCRQITMPKGTLVISKRHNTEHPYVVSKGACQVWDEVGGLKEVKAPFLGITKPGTKRVLYITEDCVWTTFHPTGETDLVKIEEAIIDKRDIEQIDPVVLQGVLTALNEQKLI